MENQKLASNMAHTSSPQNIKKCNLDAEVLNENFSTIGPEIQS